MEKHEGKHWQNFQPRSQTALTVAYTALEQLFVLHHKQPEGSNWQKGGLEFRNLIYNFMARKRFKYNAQIALTSGLLNPSKKTPSQAAHSNTVSRAWEQTKRDEYSALPKVCLAGPTRTEPDVRAQVALCFGSCRLAVLNGRTMLNTMEDNVRVWDLAKAGAGGGTHFLGEGVQEGAACIFKNCAAEVHPATFSNPVFWDASLAPTQPGEMEEYLMSDLEDEGGEDEGGVSIRGTTSSARDSDNDLTTYASDSDSASASASTTRKRGFSSMSRASAVPDGVLARPIAYFSMFTTTTTSSSSSSNNDNNNN
ncbi:hypothetical protein B484DRAFT_397270 [Ochromonadaceae sp. CCMP2298]|nr:hypothetical protein B484DRAFT_397270 [Ochromonadaceae sp. CCMP2298]